MVSVESGGATAAVFMHFSSGDMRGGVMETTAMTAAAERGGTADSSGGDSGSGTTITSGTLRNGIGSGVWARNRHRKG